MFWILFWAGDLPKPLFSLSSVGSEYTFPCNFCSTLLCWHLLVGSSDPPASDLIAKSLCGDRRVPSALSGVKARPTEERWQCIGTINVSGYTPLRQWLNFVNKSILGFCQVFSYSWVSYCSLYWPWDIAMSPLFPDVQNLVLLLSVR